MKHSRRIATVENIFKNNGEISRRYATRTTYHALPGVETPG